MKREKLHRRQIRNKVLTLALSVSMAGVGIAMAVGLAGMFIIKNTATASANSLGGRAMDESETALLEQMENNLRTYTGNKAQLADEQLALYVNYVQDFAQYLTDIYQNPDRYLPREISAPSEENAGIYALQEYHEQTVELKNIEPELQMLANVEPIWQSAMDNHNDMINSIYLGTKSGGMLAYDNQSEIASDDLFDIRGASWYRQEEENPQVRYTETYQDAYGRGLMISCYAPFYDAEGKFAGTVGIDILLGDLNQEIISTDISQGSRAVLLNEQNQVIASLDMESSKHNGDFQTVDEALGFSASEFLDQMKSDEVLLHRQGNYYYSCKKVELTGWKIMMIVPVEDITEPITEIRSVIGTDTQGASLAIFDVIRNTVLVFLLIIIMGIGAIALLAIRFSKRITNPIEQLQQDVRKISAGNLEHRADIASHDEIEDLAKDFNQMAASLMKYIDDFTNVTKEKERIGAELAVATQIQADMLPRIFPFMPERQEFDLYATMAPAKEVGGDFYDYFMVDDDHLAVSIGDVSGKGVPAALFMVISKTLIKNYTMLGMRPDEVFTKVNRDLCEGNEAELFTTAWLGIYEISTGKLIFADAGHDAPIRRKTDGTVEYIKPAKKRLMLAGMPNTRYVLNETALLSGELILLYTDGVPEATNTAGELFGQARLEKSVTAHAKDVPNVLLPHIRADVDEFVGSAPQFDDLTMLALQISR